jgi:CheY-like chemotaxis protein
MFQSRAPKAHGARQPLLQSPHRREPPHSVRPELSGNWPLRSGIGPPHDLQRRSPLVRRETPSCEGNDLPQIGSSAPNRTNAALTVLLVEDDPQALQFYRDALQVSGFEVVSARSGTEALARARARPPDAVVADLGLPDFDGFEVCRRLRLEASLNRVPAIALTGRSMALRDIELAEEAGFSSVLLKPSSPEALAQAILSACTPH